MNTYLAWYNETYQKRRYWKTDAIDAKKAYCQERIPKYTNLLSRGCVLFISLLYKSIFSFTTVLFHWVFSFLILPFLSLFLLNFIVLLDRLLIFLHYKSFSALSVSFLSPTRFILKISFHLLLQIVCNLLWETIVYCFENISYFLTSMKISMIAETRFNLELEHFYFEF